MCVFACVASLCVSHFNFSCHIIYNNAIIARQNTCFCWTIRRDSLLLFSEAQWKANEQNELPDKTFWQQKSDAAHNIHHQSEICIRIRIRIWLLILNLNLNLIQLCLIGPMRSATLWPLVAPGESARCARGDCVAFAKVESAGQQQVVESFASTSICCARQLAKAE